MPALHDNFERLRHDIMAASFVPFDCLDQRANPGVRHIAVGQKRKLCNIRGGHQNGAIGVFTSTRLYALLSEQRLLQKKPLLPPAFGRAAAAAHQAQARGDRREGAE